MSDVSRQSRWGALCVTASLLTAFLSACAPATRVTLLPEGDGRASSVLVQSQVQSQVLAKPYQVAEVYKDGKLNLDATTAAADARVVKQGFQGHQIMPSACM